MKTAIYPGSFDPITLGHLNVIRRASGIFEHVVVCIMKNAGKHSPMFTREERVELACRPAFPVVEEVSMPAPSRRARSSSRDSGRTPISKTNFKWRSSTRRSTPISTRCS